MNEAGKKQEWCACCGNQVEEVESRCGPVRMTGYTCLLCGTAMHRVGYEPESERATESTGTA